MNDLPAKRKRKLGVAPTKPQFVHPMQNERVTAKRKPEIVSLFESFHKKGHTRDDACALFLSYILSFIFGLPFGGKACRPRTLPSPAHTLRA